MMKRLALLSLAIVGVAGIAQAQTIYRTYQTPAPAIVYHSDQPRSQALTMDSGAPYAPAITDEYGMRYNSRGDRIDAQGRIMPPPVTPPGVSVYR